MVMKLVIWWCCLCVAAADDADIRFYVNSTSLNNNVAVSECMPQNATYIMLPNQTVNIHIISNDRDDFFAVCRWHRRKYNSNSSLIRITDSWRVAQVVLEDIGHTSGSLECGTGSKGEQKTLCSVYIKIDGSVDDQNVTYNRSIIWASMMITSDQPRSVVVDLRFGENTWLVAVCNAFSDNTTAGSSLVRRVTDENGNVSTTALYSVSDTRRRWFSIQLNNGSYNENQVLCIRRNALNNESWETGVKLRNHQSCRGTVNINGGYWLMIISPLVCMFLVFLIVVTAVYRRHRNKTTTSDIRNRGGSHQYEQIPCVALGVSVDGQMAVPPSLALPPLHTDDDHHYEEIYDIMYEERRRLERLRLELQNAMDPCERPLPPSVETIPFQVLRARLSASSSRQFLDPGSAISPSDLYLLKIDSEGYEIPEDLKCIPLPSRNEEQLDIRQIHLESQEKGESSRRRSPPSLESLLRVAQAGSRLPAATSATGPQLLAPGSAISPSDLYLLNIDSEGYEIPDECKFVPLPLRSAEHT